MLQKTFIYTYFISILLLSCSKNNEVEVIAVAQSKPNILLIIADDMGLDSCSGYNLGISKPTMPNLESMINSGVRFTNLWSNPTCTPTRSSILTGKYGIRTNMLKVGDELSTSEISIQKYLDNNLGQAYNHAVIGKWHLATNTDHPINMGVNYYAGLLTGGVSSYWDWNLTENNITTNSTEYSTTKITDLAVNWVENQTKPWFLWLAYNAPHSPFHLPPNNLHSQGFLPTDEASIAANPLPYYMSMVEAMDSEIGRLLSSLSQEQKNNTVIIFIGDNGTPQQVAQEYNPLRVKGTVYQGGINVPMIISGKDVSRFNATEDALINTTDLFATIANIAGIEVDKINDSQNFKELLSNENSSSRDYAYSEVGYESGKSDYTIRNKTHKYIAFEDGTEKLYNLNTDPLELIDLMHINQLPLNGTDELIKEELILKLNKIRQ
ncbi:sulfatase-like hydrolase/transferase [Lutibacter sp.]|uniref:sulfatase-like hydrolase/transferase n=1 Tax=Lutibacter sp. TaxID=1925666 RepID=UPI00356709A3